MILEGWEIEQKAKFIDSFPFYLEHFSSELCVCVCNKFQVILTFLLDYAVGMAMHTFKHRDKQRGGSEKEIENDKIVNNRENHTTFSTRC